MSAATQGVVQTSLSPNNHLLYSQVPAPLVQPSETGPVPCTPKNRKKGTCK